MALDCTDLINVLFWWGCKFVFENVILCSLDKKSFQKLLKHYVVIISSHKWPVSPPKSYFMEKNDHYHVACIIHFSSEWKLSSQILSLHPVTGITMA